MIAIIDYGAGNLQSVEKALRHIGCACQVASTPAQLASCEAAVLPGVGAFGEAMAGLSSRMLDTAVREFIGQGRPLLGICLGLQVLFESSEESPGVKGLSVLPGKVLRLPAEGQKVPHIGWNSLHLQNQGRLFEGIAEGSFVYFVHSYYLRAKDTRIVKASTEYSTQIHASVEQGNVFACQFHPEKSSSVGLKILENFAKIGEV